MFKMNVKNSSDRISRDYHNQRAKAARGSLTKEERRTTRRTAKELERHQKAVESEGKRHKKALDRAEMKVLKHEEKRDEARKRLEERREEVIVTGQAKEVFTSPATEQVA